MDMKRKPGRLLVLLVLWLAFYQPGTLRLAGAQDESQQRDIEAIEVTRARRQGRSARPARDDRYQVRQLPAQNRPARGGNRKSRQGQTARATKDEPVSTAVQFPVGPPPKGKTYITLGVTVWRARLATEAESKDPGIAKERMIVNQEEREVVVTRLTDESPVTDQDLIQISIEYLPERDGADAIPRERAGFLYVINREQFDRSLKNARLIFPTQLTYEGDNRLLPGKTVTLPDPKRPFRIRRGDDGGGHAQTYETYTIILSPVPLGAELPEALGRKAMALSPDLIRVWEQRWNASEARADLLGSVGRARTQRELEASGDISEVRSTEDTEADLTQDDLPPQTVFRRVVKPGEAMLVTIRLPFKASVPKP
ncbi:MAG TPA: hypothetical protein VF735_03850 [Pyrinomonadaceae bacterium]|jgi:hypothetical protein